jgi:hypothetical protein
VQRVIDTVAGAPVALAIQPAGTANLFATNLGIPKDCSNGHLGGTSRMVVARFRRDRLGRPTGDLMLGLDAMFQISSTFGKRTDRSPGSWRSCCGVAGLHLIAVRWGHRRPTRSRARKPSRPQSAEKVSVSEPGAA